MNAKKTPDEYFNTPRNWQNEVLALREILCGTELVEKIKWGAPCYTFDGKNIVGLGAFKDYFGLWFHQGVLLADKNKVLINAQEGKTRALRQWRMASMENIDSGLVTAYIHEAIDLAKAGKSITPERNKPIVIPYELSTVLSLDETMKDAFDALRPGLKREYADYISEAKQATTKERRLEKILPMILAGIGLNDKYRKSKS